MNEQEQTIVKKQTDVSFSCFCPITDNEFRHNIVKVSLRINSAAFPSCINSYSDNVMTKFMINKRADP